MNHKSIENWKHQHILFFLLCLSFFILMAGNQVVTLTHPDEVFYAQTAKEMIHHHSWMTPYLFDAPQFEKPIFFYWLLIMGFKLFGSGAFVARFWPAIFGIFGVFVTYWISFLIFKNKRTALFSSIILCTSLIYLILSRAVLTDMVFSIWVTLAITFFLYGYVNSARKEISIILFFISCALAVLTKGILGILFPLGIVIAFLMSQRQLGYLKSWATALGALLFLLIALPWHLLMIKLYGHRFIDEYWHNVHIRRILEAEHTKSNTWYFYLMTMFVGMFPWSFFLVPAGYLVWKSVWNHNQNRKSMELIQERDALKFLLLWIVIVYLIVQSAQSKLASYILPAFPAIAIILGYYFAKISNGIDQMNNVKFFRWASYGLAGILLIAPLAAIIVVPQYRSMIPNWKPIYIFVVLAVLCSTVIFYFIKKQRYVQAIFSICGIPLLILVTLFNGYSSAEPWVSCKLITDALKRIDPPEDSVILSSKFYLRGVRFYTDRETAVIDINGAGFFSPHPVLFLNTDEKVLDFLEKQSVTYCILKKSNVEDLKRIAQGHFILDSFEDIGGKFIVRVMKRGSSS